MSDLASAPGSVSLSQVFVAAMSRCSVSFNTEPFLQTMTGRTMRGRTMKDCDSDIFYRPAPPSFCPSLAFIYRISFVKRLALRNCYGRTIPALIPGLLLLSGIRTTQIRQECYSMSDSRDPMMTDCPSDIESKLPRSSVNKQTRHARRHIDPP